MKLYECRCCGYLVLSEVILALKSRGRTLCMHPGGCDEPFEKFTLLLDDDEESADLTEEQK